MFDFGFSEMLIIGVVALVVLGPERLPVVARTAGEWIGKAQRFVAQVKSDINRESELAELKKLQEEAQAIANDVKTEVDSAARDIEKDVNEAAKAAEIAGTDAQKAVSEAGEAASEAAASAEKAVKDAGAAAPTIDKASDKDIADVYGWGSNTPASSEQPAWGWQQAYHEPKTFDKRYHSGPSVEELAAEIGRLRRELGMRETNIGGSVGRRRDLAPRARSNRPRIYR